MGRAFVGGGTDRGMGVEQRTGAAFGMAIFVWYKTGRAGEHDGHDQAGRFGGRIRALSCN